VHSHIYTEVDTALAKARACFYVPCVITNPPKYGMYLMG
jgi:hypothetical protein